MEINFRPHHFLCTLCFQGKGYSPTFVANYEQIVTQLNQESQTPIHVVNRTDSICNACPQKQDALCTTEAKVQQLDNAHAEALGIAAGDILNWKQAKERIAQRIDLKTFHKICATCSWKELGICETVVTALRPRKAR